MGRGRAGPVRIASLAVRCPEADGTRARLHLTASLDAVEAGMVELRTTVEPGDVDHRHRVAVAAGATELSWSVEVPAPRLWWPKALSPDGSPPELVEVTVEVWPAVGRAPVADINERALFRPTAVDADGAPLRGAVAESVLGSDAGLDGPSDVTVRRTGLRQVRLRGSVLEVNGERLFLKGASLATTGMTLHDATPAELGRDVALAQDAGLDLLRVYGPAGPPALYEAADQAGLLVWQDVPVVEGFSPGARRRAVALACVAAGALAHHPSVALWGAHDQPALGPEQRSQPASGADGRFAEAVTDTTARPSICAHLLRCVRTAVVGAAVARALQEADDSRPVLPAPGVVKHLARWRGWLPGEDGDLPSLLRRIPALAHFVTGFGAPAGTEPATQQHQATLLRHHIEALRRLKYRPTGGFCLDHLIYDHSAVSCAVLDHERVPKLGYAALRAACAPVLLTADRPAATYAPGTPVALDIHVVSDLRHPLPGCTVHATLTWPGGVHRWAFGGDMPADTVSRVCTLSFVVPDAPGPLVLDLHLDGPVTASASYASMVVDR